MQSISENLRARFVACLPRDRKHLLGLTLVRYVSADFEHSTYSAVCDAQSAVVIGGSFVEVLVWCDNEWGFSCRMTELIELIGKKAASKRTASISLYSSNEQGINTKD